jgi:hypothetical protein
MEPYRRLSRQPQLAKDSILVFPPTNPFAGLWQAVRRREILVALVAFASILSMITPIFLSNIPFNPAQTWTLHVVSTWTSIAILSFMVLMLLLQLVTKYPYLPVDPKSVTARIYYLADSKMLDTFQETSLLTEKELLQQIDPGMRYSLQTLVCVSGKTRIGVDYAKLPLG